MWRVRFLYFHPIIEIEDEVYLDFQDELSAWRFHELVFKSLSVYSVRKPIKII